MVGPHIHFTHCGEREEVSNLSKKEVREREREGVCLGEGGRGNYV